MENNYYDFEGLWFEIYQNVANHNQRLNGNGLDKSQLKEVTTSIFIAESHKGISRPQNTANSYSEPESDPEIVPTQQPEQPFNSGFKSNKTPSDKQINMIKSLLKNPKVTDEEQLRITEVLAGQDFDKQTAKEVLDYFFGQSKRNGNQWVKITEGVLAER